MSAREEQLPGHPVMAAQTGRVEPCPRRVRGLVGQQVVFDTTRGLYVWEHPRYPQFHIPVADVANQLLVAPNDVAKGPNSRDLLIGDDRRPNAATLHPQAAGGLAGTLRFEWDALDRWYEEDEEVFVHPRNPYVRVDALRSHRLVRVERDGLVLAETRSPVLLFETGLPTRYYVDRTDVRFEHLVPTETETACPYKGRTTTYWSVRDSAGRLHRELAWSYDFPTPAVHSVAGMVAFYNERVDTFIDGMRLPRPVPLR